MACSSGDDPGGSRNEFGAVTTLLLTGKNGTNLPCNPFIIGKSIENFAGAIESAKSEAKCTRYILRTRSATQVKKLLQMSQLFDGTEVSIVLHPTLNISRCVISSFDLLPLSGEVIEKELNGQGVIKARRILKSNKENTPAIILTFNKSIYPETVKVGVLRVRTRPYYPNPMLCFKCYEYGHPRLNCPNDIKRCYNCSNEHEKRETCEEQPFCRNCKGDHRPSSRQCEIFKTEVAVIRTKIDYNLSYVDARKRVATGNGSYAQVAAQHRLDHARLNTLSNQLKEKQAEISKLGKELEQRQALEEKMNTIIEQNKEKDDKINELLQLIRDRDTKIEKLELQSQKMKKFIDTSLQSRSRSNSQTSEPEHEGIRKKSKRGTIH
ncbi:uncharacterized protein LOC129773264 [Toxorhynchites rutilus septentrionalis]|uniref:uncharacterized protein LOC129773264 n=1 Tax=Toxorhynchites rutilus septentrionalis TaxID=329112 RepID=UPI002478B192|nr:uncharacterized protein LOC129773264 [Toxorhynchites rutilus septentrionalis]